MEERGRSVRSRVYNVHRCSNSGNSVLRQPRVLAFTWWREVEDNTSGCYSDVNCSDGEFCDIKHCTSPCGCVNGSWTCANTCVAKCKIATCTPPSETFTSQICGRVCDVVVRVNSGATQILSYKVVCGAQTAQTLEEARAQLLPSSRINWSHATSYSSDTQGYLFVHENPYDVIAFGAITGARYWSSTSMDKRRTYSATGSPRPISRGVVTA